MNNSRHLSAYKKAVSQETAYKQTL
ncbi:hypothetical protein BN1007_71207 [Klebsiella variicola]|nr:hypothetical protein KVR801_200072 [Klebsiella variicola]CEP30448.1 hypothetical protein KV8917_370014 [Klebsiella variicola]CTQ18929.1 hypothetical protein BN1007_71207 [Klebsiella variicola]CTQ25823.1 hypothetical protein BN1200_890022 [Klebsiella variicola]